MKIILFFLIVGVLFVTSWAISSGKNDSQPKLPLQLSPNNQFCTGTQSPEIFVLTPPTPTIAQAHRDNKCYDKYSNKDIQCVEPVEYNKERASIGTQALWKINLCTQTKEIVTNEQEAPSIKSQMTKIPQIVLSTKTSGLNRTDILDETDSWRLAFNDNWDKDTQSSHQSYLVEDTKQNTTKTIFDFNLPSNPTIYIKYLGTDSKKMKLFFLNGYSRSENGFSYLAESLVIFNTSNHSILTQDISNHQEYGYISNLQYINKNDHLYLVSVPQKNTNYDILQLLDYNISTDQIGQFAKFNILHASNGTQPIPTLIKLNSDGIVQWEDGSQEHFYNSKNNQQITIDKKLGDYFYLSGIWLKDN